MDWRSIDNEREKYAAYLCSRDWSERREAVRERAGGKCERCRVLPMDACHHLTYARKYNESLEDLQAICDPCHKFTHGKSDFDPEQTYGLVRYFQKCAEAKQLAAPIEVLLGQKWSLDFESKYAPAMYALETIQRERGNLMAMQPWVIESELNTHRLYGIEVRLGSIAETIERSEKLPFSYADALQWSVVGKHDETLLRFVANLVRAEFAAMEDYCNSKDQDDLDDFHAAIRS